MESLILELVGMGVKEVNLSYHPNVGQMQGNNYFRCTCIMNNKTYITDSKHSFLSAIEDTVKGLRIRTTAG